MKSANNYNLPLVVIFGRTNVGKSTLFNRLTEKKQALVSKIAGTTRDSNLAEMEWQGISFNLVDTGGIIETKLLAANRQAQKINRRTGEIDIKVQQQARDYLKRADLILFLVDARDGLNLQDKEMAMYLKRDCQKNKIVLVANKVDNLKLRLDTAEFNKLSLGEPALVSAANGSGTGDLLDIVVEKINKSAGRQLEKDNEDIRQSIRVSIIGKPNVGKSSLLNSLIGRERVIVSPIPHTTREPQNREIRHGDTNLIFVDTAGISKKGGKIKGANTAKIITDGILKSLKALRQSDIALLVIDISQEITHQDLKLVEEIVEMKKSFIIVANKWDLIPEKDLKKYTAYIYAKMPFCVWAPIHFTSALSGARVKKIMDLILTVYEQKNLKIGDSTLNRFLNKVVKIHRPAKSQGLKHPRIYELKQTRINPPQFYLRIGARDNLHYSYIRFIENRLREKFGFIGTPLTTRITKGRDTREKKTEA